MSDPTRAEVSRRKFLAMGGSLAAAGTLGSLLEPWDALGATRWPKGQLGAHDAVRVRESQFMPASQFRAWNKALDRVGPANQKGLRATGSRAHEHYVDDLRFESVPMRRWTTTRWSLDLLAGPAAGSVRTASYIPYSGQTPPQGVVGPLAFVEPGSTPAPGSL